MAHSTRGALGQQVRTLLAPLEQSTGLPFSQWLPADKVQAALDAEQVTYRQRIFTPVVTLWAFLSQVFSKDYSCLQAVARVLACRQRQGLTPCSTNTGSYCKARGRLPEGVLSRLARAAGRDLHDRVPEEWRWNGRRIKVVDGSSVGMPDTADNQAAYPQPSGQAAGVGFPVARIVVIFCLACCTALDLAIGPQRGKRTGEPALLRALHDGLEPDDLLLGDRCFGSYCEFALLQQRHVDAVFRMHQIRTVDFRRGRRLGPHDHVVTWYKPQRPDWMDEATYQALPECLTMREVQVVVRLPGFRTQVLVVATTLLDALAWSRAELAAVYRARWHAELDLRAVKHSLHLDVVRGQTPEMVQKEVWAHLLVYNLLRGVLAEAALRHGTQPRHLSFAAARQLVEAFEGLLAGAEADELEEILECLLEALASHRVGNRPNRYEPRVRKRRPKNYPLMKQPRQKLRNRMAKGVRA